MSAGCRAEPCMESQNSLSEAVDTGGRHLENVRPSGGVPEWPKGSDCKSDARASVVRIHPPPPRFMGWWWKLRAQESGKNWGAEPDKPHCESGEPSCGGWFEVKAPSAGKGRGHSSMVEPQPSKLMMRVRFPLPAPNPASCFCSYSSVGRALPW